MPTFNHSAAKRAVSDKGLTIAAVARMMEPPMDRAVLSNILNGNRKGSVDLAVRLAQVTGDDPYAYLGPDDRLAAAINVARLAIETALSLGASRDDLLVSA